MTAQDPDNERAEDRLAEILEAEANRTVVEDGWGLLSSRLLLESEAAPAEAGPVTVTRRGRGLLGGVVLGLGVAAVILAAVVLGRRASGA